MKKAIGFTKQMISVVLVLALVLILVPTSASAAKKVKLNKTKVTLKVGKTVTLKLKNNKKKVKWTSSNKKVATVTSKGKVKAKKAGKATITAKVGKKKYKCKVTVQAKKSTTKVNPAGYGSISGNVTYYYNQYQGHKADTGARVILIPTDGSAKNANVTPYSSESDLNKYHIYIGKVDGIGNYTINHIPIGNYKVLMISSETSYGGWFAAYDDAISDAPQSYYDNIAKSYYPSYLSQLTALAFADSVSFHKFYKTDVTIYRNEATILSHDFGMTYV